MRTSEDEVEYANELMIGLNEIFSCSDPDTFYLRNKVSEFLSYLDADKTPPTLPLKRPWSGINRDTLDLWMSVHHALNRGLVMYRIAKLRADRAAEFFS